MRRVSKFIVLCVALGVCCGAVYAQQTRRHKAGGAEATTQERKTATSFVQQFDQVALSPDGQLIAWVETQIDKQGTETGKHDIYVAEYERSVAPRRISGGAAAAGAHFDEHDMTWSPDSRQLAFLSDVVKKGQLQLGNPIPGAAVGRLVGPPFTGHGKDSNGRNQGDYHFRFHFHVTRP